MSHTISEALPDLAQFYGTDGYHVHRAFGAPPILLTDGAHYVREKAGAYWLMDIIGYGQSEWLLEGGGFCVVKLAVTKHSAVLTVTDGDENALHEQDIEFTDFPEPGIEFFLDGRSGGEPVLMLKNEY